MVKLQQSVLILRVMNRSLRAILLLVLYISTATELPQFAKLPLLVVHAIEHAQREQLTIGAFIAEHYFQGDVYDADRAQDLQLPFKVELPGALLLLAEPAAPARHDSTQRPSSTTSAVFIPPADYSPERYPTSDLAPTSITPSRSISSRRERHTDLFHICH